MNNSFSKTVARDVRTTSVGSPENRVEFWDLMVVCSALRYPLRCFISSLSKTEFQCVLVRVRVRFCFCGVVGGQMSMVGWGNDLIRDVVSLGSG